MNLILASKSAARQAMLKNAGLEFQSIPAEIDERAFGNAGSPKELAGILAVEKAKYVARLNPDALVIGSDQILEFEGKTIHKAQNLQDAKEKLSALRGKTHSLISAVAVVKGETTLWSDAQAAALTMHDFDDAFLSAYVEKAGDALTQNVGAYALEGEGVHLFDKIEGDYFTILGLPLLPLLKYLREDHGAGL